MATQTTTDHRAIQRWAEARGGKPARVRATGEGEDPGVLRIDFPGYTGSDTLETIAWDEWFDKFEQQNLALVIDEELHAGERSNFNKLVSRDG